MPTTSRSPEAIEQPAAIRGEIHNGSAQAVSTPS